MSRSIRDRPGLIVLVVGIACLLGAVGLGYYLSDAADRPLLPIVPMALWAGFGLGSFLTLAGLRIIARPDPDGRGLLAKIDRYARSIANRVRPRFRLGTFLALIACLALGLSMETNRLRREARELETRRFRDLRLVAEGRKQRAEEHRLRGLALKGEEEQLLANIERQKKAFAFGGSVEGGRSHRGYSSADQLDLIRRRIEWERIMAANARWAADHPEHPWPDSPPYPERPVKSAR